jgi:hypothetical protein
LSTKGTQLIQLCWQPKRKKQLAAAFLKEKFLNHEVFDQLLYIYGTRQRKKVELSDGLRPQKLHLYGGNLKGLEKLHLRSMGGLKGL